MGMDASWDMRRGELKPLKCLIRPSWRGMRAGATGGGEREID